MEEELLNRFIKLEKLITERNIQEVDFLSVVEASLYLGIKKSTLYKLTHNRKIPYFCPGGKLIYFQKSDLNEFILRNRQHSSEELNGQVGNYLNRHRKNSVIFNKPNKK